MKNITCRACTAADAAALAALGAQTFCETFEHCNTSEDMRQYISENFTPAALARELAMPQSEFYLAESAGRPAAYMKLNFGAAQTEPHFPGCAEVQRLYVLAECKRTGIGKALMETALRRAREEDSAGIWLGVWERNYPAQAFYKMFGFSQVGAHTFVLGQDVQTDLIFYKKLP